MLNNIIAYFFLISSLAACNSDVKEDTVATKMMSPGNKVLVLCDVSKSIDKSVITDSLKAKAVFVNMIRNCQHLLRCFPAETNFQFYVVSKNTNSMPFFEFEAGVFNERTKRLIRKKFHIADSTLSARIDSASRNPESQSCILTSVESAYKTLKDNSISSKNIFIFSDLVEACSCSPAGRIFIDINAKSIIDKKCLDSLTAYNPNVDFKANNISVAVINNTYSESQSSTQLINIWNTLWSKFNIKDEDRNEAFLYSKMVKIEKLPIFKNL